MTEQFIFTRATKAQARLRLGLAGPSGSGKTWTMLALASGLGARIAVIDTERGSSSKYADEFTFDVLQLANYDPRNYIEAIHAAEASGYDVIGIDGLSHAWMGKGGTLELKDAATKRNKGDSFGAWRDVTPLHNELVDTLLQSPCHIIATLRVKTDYVVEKDENGKNRPRKIGLAPVQRDGLEYEFDIMGELDMENTLVISKSRCPVLSGAVISKPGAAMAEVLLHWLSSDDKGAPAPQTITRSFVSPDLGGERGNGRPHESAKAALLKMGPKQFDTAARELARQFEDYRKVGTVDEPDKFFILCAARSAGFADITENNLPVVLEALAAKITKHMES